MKNKDSSNDGSLNKKIRTLKNQIKKQKIRINKLEVLVNEISRTQRLTIAGLKMMEGIKAESDERVEKLMEVVKSIQELDEGSPASKIDIAAILKAKEETEL